MNAIIMSALILSLAIIIHALIVSRRRYRDYDPY